MKKTKVLIFLFSLILFSSLVSAFYTEPTLILQKKNFQPGETLLGTIEGNFSSKILPSQIKFYNGRREFFVDFSVVYFEGTHYLYAYMEKEGNYTIKITNILYKDGTLKSKTIEEKVLVKLVPKITEIEKNISGNITKENITSTEILSIKPGLIYSLSNPEITLFNKGTSDLNITLKDNEEQKILLKSLQAQTIPLNLKEGISTLKISSYEDFNVPALFFPFKNNTEIINGSIISEHGLRFDNYLFSFNSTQGKEIKIPLQSSNVGNNLIKIKDISSNLSILKIEKIDSLNPNESKIINLSFLSNTPGYFSGEILVEFDEENYTQEVPIIIGFEAYIFPTNSSSVIPSDVQKEKTCAELGGQVCINQGCFEENYVFLSSSGEFCCLSKCEDLNSSSSSGSSKAFLGLLIFLLLAIIGYFVWKKYKKAKPQDSNQVLQKNSKLFEKRITGGLSRN